MSGMSRIRRVLAGAFLLAGAASMILSASPGRASTSGAVVELHLDGVVDPFVANYLSSAISDANASHAAAVVILIDTPGGLDSSMREINQAILASRVPVIGYVSPSGARAASAGTFIMMACPYAAMAPGTEIGAAHPVGVSGVIEQEKVTNDAAAYIQSLAQRYGRNAVWAASAVRNSVSVSAEEALKLPVIDTLASSVPQLLDKANGQVVKVSGGKVTIETAGAPIESHSIGFGASILHSLFSPDLAFIFFYAGIGLVIIEILHPGISVPGILGVLFLVLSFISFGELPVQLAGIALLIASAVSFLLELKHPGLGAASVVGTVTLIVGGLLLFNRSAGAGVSLWVIIPVAVLMIAFFATIVRAAMTARHLPRERENARLIGAEGVVTRTLKPEGTVLVASESWSAASDGAPIAKGTRVRVKALQGLRLVVEPVEQAAPEMPAPREGSST
jgi:membrane-bound serine protease (ClpP class)